jgi:hypothetical protein
MYPIARRTFIRSLGLGAGAALLTPLCRSLLAEAAGKPVDRRRILFYVTGNGWGHQSMPLNAMGPANGVSFDGPLFTTVRSETDYDMPKALAPLAPWRAKTTIVGNFYNPHGQNLHGNGNATLCVMPNSAGQAGGISIDRFIGKSVGANDPVSSTVMALSEFGKLDKNPFHCAADGPSKPIAAPNTPVRAFATYIGGQTPQPGATGGADATIAIDQDKSVLDAMIADVTRVRNALVGFERQKFDQILESCRDVEKRLATRRSLAATGAKPVPPDPALDKTGIKKEVIRGFVDVTFQTLAFGITHVGHISVFGRDAYNDTWGTIGIPHDTHLGIMHKGVKNMPGYDYTAAVHSILTYQASELAHLLQRLKDVPEEGGSMADNTLVVWLNAGGGKHHDGYNTIPAVLIGDLGGKIPAGRFMKVNGKRCISDLFVSLARAMGVDVMKFGDPTHGQGPIFGA